MYPLPSDSSLVGSICLLHWTKMHFSDFFSLVLDSVSRKHPVLSKGFASQREKLLLSNYQGFILCCQPQRSLLAKGHRDPSNMRERFVEDSFMRTDASSVCRGV